VHADRGLKKKHSASRSRTNFLDNIDFRGALFEMNEEQRSLLKNTYSNIRVGGAGEE
jgi:hypothetical protein